MRGRGRRSRRPGVHDVLYEGLKEGEGDFSSIVSKIKSADVDIVYDGGAHY